VLTFGGVNKTKHEKLLGLMLSVMGHGTRKENENRMLYPAPLQLAIYPYKPHKKSILSLL